MWEITLPVLFGGLLLWIAFMRHRQRLRDWQEAAVTCGLQVMEVAEWGQQLTVGKGPLEVKIEPCGNKGQSTRIIVSVPGSTDFYSVSIRREPLLRRAREIEIGESSFDSTFLLEGPAPQVLALLDAEMRSLLIEVNTECQLEISAGALRAEDMSDEQVPYVLPLLLDIGRRLTQTTNVPQRLAENAHRDPEDGVRLRNLLALIGEHSRDPRTIEALRTACSDPSPEIRLRAAKELGAEGRGVLLDLAESLVDDAVSAEAVSILDRALPFERTTAILDHALDRQYNQTTRVCLEALGKSGDTAAVDALAQVMTREQGEPAAAAAQALGTTESPAAEPPLIDALQREQADLRVAAATALGLLGSVAAVLPLKEAAERFWLDLELRRATRQAIAGIQSRLGGASPGQLSLAETETGQLSLAPFEAGQLSLAQDEPPPREREKPPVRRA